MINRYFIVYYSAITEKGKLENDIAFKTNGRFVNKVKTLELIRKNSSIRIWSIVIKNIIELNKTDYDDWTGKL